MKIGITLAAAVVLLSSQIPAWGTTIVATGMISIINGPSPLSADVVGNDSASFGLSYDQGNVYAVEYVDAGPYSGSITNVANDDYVPDYEPCFLSSGCQGVQDDVVTVSLSGWYMVTGGQGSTSVFINSAMGPDPANFGPSCTLSLDGITTTYWACAFGPSPSFQVDFNTPFFLSLNIDWDVSGPTDGDGEGGGFGYDLESGLPAGVEITAIPEPTSALLIISGLSAMLLRRARKFCRRQGKVTCPVP